MQQFLEMVDKGKLVTGWAPAALTNATGPDWVSIKGYKKASIIIIGDNGTSVTNSQVTLQQATAVAGTSAKTLPFSKYWANEDTAASDTLTNTSATSNTFNTVTTNAKNFLYVIEVEDTDLDQANNFDCIRMSGTNQANSVMAVLYYLHGPRYANPAGQSAITD